MNDEDMERAAKLFLKEDPAFRSHFYEKYLEDCEETGVEPADDHLLPYRTWGGDLLRPTRGMQPQSRPHRPQHLVHMKRPERGNGECRGR